VNPVKLGDEGAATNCGAQKVDRLLRGPSTALVRYPPRNCEWWVRRVPAVKRDVCSTRL